MSLRRSARTPCPRVGPWPKTRRTARTVSSASRALPADGTCDAARRDVAQDAHEFLGRPSVQAVEEAGEDESRLDNSPGREPNRAAAPLRATSRRRNP